MLYKVFLVLLICTLCMFVCMRHTLSSICLSYTDYTIILHENFLCITDQHTTTVHESHCQPTKKVKKKKERKIQRRAHMHEHNCAWFALSGSSSLGCGVANRMLSSVFPAGCLTVTLFSSWANRLLPAIPSMRPQKRGDGNVYVCYAPVNF